MPKFSREELSARVNDLDIDEEIKMGLIEDITDSIIDESEELAKLKGDLEEKSKAYDGLYEKYKSRFMESKSDVEDKKEDNEIDEEKIIDIREI